MGDTETFTPLVEDLGHLPETPTNETPKAYDLPVEVPTTAKSVLIYTFVTTRNEGPFQRGYYEFYTKEGDAKYMMYMNIATGTPSVTINSMNSWFPVAADRKVYVELIHPEDTSVAHKEGVAPKRANKFAKLCCGEWSQLFVTGFK